MKEQKVFVAGHKGMVGSAILRKLESNNNLNLVIKDKNELDLSNSEEVLSFFKEQNFDSIYLAAAKVGGIISNSAYPADFIYENIIIQSNVIRSAFEARVRKLLFLGSSCIYPRNAAQPISENELLSGPLEQTNEAYAIAKIAGIKMCESFNRQHGTDYRSIMPTNLYGINDNFHPENSHVVPGLINRIHLAKINNLKQVEIWGTGTPKREFLFVDDMADASIFIMNLSKSKYNSVTTSNLSHVNVGWGVDYSITQLSKLICEVVGFKGNLFFDSTKPDGMPRKVLNTQLINKLGWTPKVTLREGIEKTYEWYLNNIDNLRR